MTLESSSTLAPPPPGSWRKETNLKDLLRVLQVGLFLGVVLAGVNGRRGALLRLGGVLCGLLGDGHVYGLVGLLLWVLQVGLFLGAVLGCVDGWRGVFLHLAKILGGILRGLLGEAVFSGMPPYDHCLENGHLDDGLYNALEDVFDDIYILLLLFYKVSLSQVAKVNFK